MLRVGKTSSIVLAVLALFVVFGCSLRSGDGLPAEGESRYIRLNVRAPSAPRAITVTEYAVTGLDIQVRGPDQGLLKTIDWTAADGPQSYLIPVREQGEHQIIVTHMGEQGGQTVQATESATFDIRAMVITVIDIVPGSVGVINVAGGGAQPPGSGLVGHWFGSGVEQPGQPQFIDADVTINADGSFESLLYDVGGSTLQNMSMDGTYTVANDVFNAVTSQIYQPGGWMAVVMNWSVSYTLDADTLTLHQDFDQDGTTDFDWVLTRQ